jgi:hypothetical protein
MRQGGGWNIISPANIGRAAPSGKAGRRSGGLIRCNLDRSQHRELKTRKNLWRLKGLATNRTCAKNMSPR